MNNICKVKTVTVVIQENGLVRDVNGLIIASLIHEVNFDEIEEPTND